MIYKLREAGLGLLALIGSLAILALMVHIMTDVTLRNAINQPVPATYEIVTNYYMVALAFIPLAWVEKSGGMVNVELLDGFLGPRLLWLSDRVVALLSTGIYLLLAWVTLLDAVKAYKAGTFVMAQSLSIPTWPAFFLPPLGFVLAASVTLTRLYAPLPKAAAS
ncbi:MAG: TRAP transporter small permease [Pseudooceanicola sp.]|nr:TRAP transporter small permease [Pseudooceanicola sp.]